MYHGVLVSARKNFTIWKGVMRLSSLDNNKSIIKINNKIIILLIEHKLPFIFDHVMCWSVIYELLLRISKKMV